MKNPNNIERDLNSVRVELYEQTKDMSPKERVVYYRELSAPVRKEFGIRTANEIKADTQKRATN
jgi:hypothetical protein